MAKKKPQKGKAHHRRLKKTYLISDSDMECENENDNSRPISSLFKTKLSTDEDATQEREEKIDKGTVDTSNEKAVDDFSTESIRHADDVLLDGQMKRYFSRLTDRQGNCFSNFPLRNADEFVKLLACFKMSIHITTRGVSSYKIQLMY